MLDLCISILTYTVIHISPRHIDAERSPVSFRRVARDIVAATRVDRARVEEVLVQVIDELQDVALHGSRHGDVIDQAECTIRELVEGGEAVTATHLKWMTYSQSPTPPACGHTGIPNLD